MKDNLRLCLQPDSQLDPVVSAFCALRICGILNNNGVPSEISEHEQATSSSSTSTIRFRRRFGQFNFRFRFIQRQQWNNDLLLVLHLELNMPAEICEGEDRTGYCWDVIIHRDGEERLWTYKWPQTGSEIAQREMISCTKITELENAGKFL